MLVVVVAVFATLWLPYRALLVYNSFAEPVYMELCAINPIIYSACSIKFRRAFKRMLTCESENRNTQRTRAAAQYASGLSSTMHLSHNSVRHNTLLSVCPLKNSKDKHNNSETEQNV
ncbi:unnamed protein product [Medioppia subpectinata]|uniref:Uncharacterized protein n=1 Tax=Medioppia subpectinata TaxID=1979941 RepID=A0A7R9Q4J9_9ACAR|nr:unnamed protein product [Medioppia subpectinata]CAG2111760.1 unnamed protein product [Medioppia subpectinata]